MLFQGLDQRAFPADVVGVAWEADDAPTSVHFERDRPRRGCKVEGYEVGPTAVMDMIRGKVDGTTQEYLVGH